MVIELISKDFRDCLFSSINGRPRQVMSAEAEISPDSDIVTVYRRGSARFVDITPVYTPNRELSPTIDLFVESGTPGVYAPDFFKFLETRVNEDQIFSSGNSLHSFLGSRKLEDWKKILRRIPNGPEAKMSCSINRDIITDEGYKSLMDAFYNYMGLPVLFYLYNMGEFSRQ